MRSKAKKAMSKEEAEYEARERRWQAEADADALIRANEVKLNPARAKMAKSILAEQTAKLEERAKASGIALATIDKTAKAKKSTSKSTNRKTTKANPTTKPTGATKAKSVGVNAKGKQGK